MNRRDFLLKTARLAYRIGGFSCVLSALKGIGAKSSEAKMVIRVLSSTPETVVEWDCLDNDAGLDKYDATDGATITISGSVTFPGGGVLTLGDDDEISFVATNGNNINIVKGTIEFKYDSYAGVAKSYGRFFQYGEDAGDFCLRRNAADDSINFEIADVNAIFSMTTNVWNQSEHKIRVTWDSTVNERKIFINDSQEGGTNTDSFSAPSPTTTDFWFGTSAQTERNGEGTFSDLKIWHDVVEP